MELTFDHGSHIPDRLLHRVTTSYAPEEGAVISTHHTELHVLGSPVEGADWLADDGPSNDPDNHHRRGVVILDGQPVDSRRYAIDWEQVKDGVTFLSYHNRNVPALSTIEVAPGCSFTMPRKRSASSCFDSDSFSTDDRPWGCRILVSGMGARGKGQPLFPRSSR